MMEKALFSITCTTCQARLQVRDAAAIGQILACPKCESMVLVQPPLGWNPSSEESDPPQTEGACQPDAVVHSWVAQYRILLIGAPLVVITLVAAVWVVVSSSHPKPLPVAIKPEIVKPEIEIVEPESVKELEPEPVKEPEKAPEPEPTKEPEPVKDPEPEPAKPPELEPIQEPEPPPAPAREPLPSIDIEQSLNHRVVELELKGMPLVQFVRWVGDLSGTAITIDADALAYAGAGPNDPINIRLTDATTGEILKKGVATRGLAVHVTENGVIVTRSATAADDQLKILHYRVADIAENDSARIAQLAMLTTNLVAPATWQAAGGRGSAEAVGETVKVEQTIAIHTQVLSFFERLRRARKIPLRSKLADSRFSLETPLDLAAARMDRSVTVSFPRPTPLSRVLATLEEVGETKLLVDWVQLRGEQIGPQTLVTLNIHEQSLSQALNSVLQPLGLGYRIIIHAQNTQILQITTLRAIADHWELEFYPTADLVKQMTSARLIERVKASVAPRSWQGAGGLGAAVVDEPSGYLLVAQPQPIQAGIRQLLQEIRADLREKEKKH